MDADFFLEDHTIDGLDESQEVYPNPYLPTDDELTESETEYYPRKLSASSGSLHNSVYAALSRECNPALSLKSDQVPASLYNSMESGVHELGQSLTPATQ